MSARTLLKVALLLFLIANTASGVVKILASVQRHEGEMALARADLNLAYQSFRSTLYWESDDAPTHILIGRTISLAQANGLPLEPLEGRTPDERFRIGLATIARGIDLNPADAWAWINLADFHQGFRAGRIRLQKMIRAGEMAGKPVTSSAPPSPSPSPSGSDPDDAVSVAAALKGLELDPAHFYYHDFLAKLYWDRHMIDDAAREIRESMAVWPRVEVHSLLDNDAVIADLASAALEGIARSALSPYAGPVMAAHARAQILERIGKPGEAVEAWAELRKLGDKVIEAECDLQLGRLEMDRGNFERSIDYLKEATTEAPDDLPGIWALYYLGIIHSRQSNHAEAIKFLRSHLAKAPDSYAGYQALGTELESVGQSAEAEKLFIAAVRRFPDNPSAYLNVIEQMRHHGRAKQALLYAEALRKVGSDREETEALIEALTRESARKAP